MKYFYQNIQKAVNVSTTHKYANKKYYIKFAETNRMCTFAPEKVY